MAPSRSMILARAVVLCLGVCELAAQTPAWVQNPAPIGRLDHAMAYDAERGQVVLFGGYDGAERNDTWVWDGNAWSLKNPANKPPARRMHALAYDAVRKQVVLFGGDGYSASTYRNDTWVWDGSNWTQKAPATSPPARVHHAMAYDAARGQVVLFGGYDGSDRDDTWVWDGNAWSLKNPTDKPPARSMHALAFDAARGQVVLFGGYRGWLVLGDTGRGMAATGARRLPATVPAERRTHWPTMPSAHRWCCSAAMKLRITGRPRSRQATLPPCRGPGARGLQSI